MRRSRRTGALVVTLLLTGSTIAGAVGLEQRTFWISAPPGGGMAGESLEPDLAPSGQIIAFTTTSETLAPGDANGPVADVVLLDAARGERRLVSAPEGVVPDGPASAPSVAEDGQRVAFVSAATNLVPGDDNGATDVFVRDGTGAILAVSVRPDGVLGNRPSRAPRLSADGRRVAFESDASDLVPGDSNGQTDVFVRDLQAGTTTRVSVATDGTQGTVRSGTPSISADGRVVSFESAATTLVQRDTNRQPDVFVHDLEAGTTERVSISSAGVQQNRGVKAPFRAGSDLDRSGRLVVFESEATNLTRGDTNRRADVFLHDRRTGRTRLISASTSNVQGNNDSVSPVITPSGRYVAFQSFATNLVPRDTTGPDVLVRDLQLRTTAIATVATDGSRRRPERTGQVLQRPAISDRGTTVAFTSTAPEFVPADRGAESDVFIRRLDPPTTSVRRRTARSVTVQGDDPAVDRYVCSVDALVPFPCGPTVSLVQPGRKLTVRAMGPGMLADPIGRTFTALRDRVRPKVRVTRIPRSRSQRTIRGAASDRGGAGVDRVEIAVTFVTRTGRCFFLDGGRYRATRDCKIRRFTAVATGRSRWSLVLPRLPVSFVAFEVRSVDRSGNRSATVSRSQIVR